MTGVQDVLKRVLVADDSPAIRSLAESILRQAGYDVSTVDNGADAIEWIKGKQPDLVLLDLSLPGLDGGRVCELLKSDSSLQRIFVLILLKANEIKRIKELKNLGADGFVIKPFVPKDLVRQLESLLDKEKTEIKDEKVPSQIETDSKPIPSQPHNYEWFVSEMQKETEDKSLNTTSQEKPSPAEKDSPQDNEIKYEAKEVSSQDGYENFISQFKGEVKTSGPEEPLVYGELEIDGNTEPTTRTKTLEQKPPRETHNKEMSLDPERVTKELIHEVASKIAQEIVENLDKETLENLIKIKIEEFKI